VTGADASGGVPQATGSRAGLACGAPASTRHVPSKHLWAAGDAAQVPRAAREGASWRRDHRRRVRGL